MSDKNIGASVYARLKNLSKGKGVDMSALLRRYAQERLLFRLSRSTEAANFCIKGGLLLSAYNQGDLLRPTEDIDFNGFNKIADIGVVEEALKRILQTPVDDDGVVFDVRSMIVKKDRVGIIPGGKIQLQATVHTAKVDVRVDVGFGNAISPEVKRLVMPTLLEGVAPQPEVLAYPLETVISEKIHAMAQFGLLNTRVKDYFDIWVLMKTQSFEFSDLVEAVRRTFEAQSRDIPAIPLEGLSEDYIEDQEMTWKSFLKRIDYKDKLELSDVVDDLAEFIHPILTEVSNTKVHLRIG